MINVQVSDGKRALRIGKEGEISVSLHPHPPPNETQYPVPFYQKFTDDGAVTGSSDMVIDGATTPTDFYVASRTDRDVWISQISVQISDTGASLDEFGALAALTNGIEFFFDTNKTGRVQIGTDITTNLEFMRLAGGNPAFGDGTKAFLADISGGGQDTYLPVISIKKTFGLIWGLRLRLGTTDKVGFLVRDNLAGIAVFNIEAYGMAMDVDA